MVISVPWDDYIEMIAFYPVKAIARDEGINPMGLSDPWVHYIDIISLRTVKTIARDLPNGH